jgi:pimeloyl-ACP methyl ester carboxylesterase
VTAGSETKPTVVLVHGAFADGSSWNGVIERLQEAGVPVIAPANPLRGVTFSPVCSKSCLVRSSQSATRTAAR